MYRQLLRALYQRSALVYHLPALGAVLVIHYFSTLPVTSLTPSLPLSDKFLHAAGYGLLTVLLKRSFQNSNLILKKWSMFAAMGYALCLGIAEEVQQIVIPGRHFDGMDVLANAVGTLLLAPLMVPVVSWIDCKLDGKHLKR